MLQGRNSGFAAAENNHGLVRALPSPEEGRMYVDNSAANFLPATFIVEEGTGYLKIANGGPNVVVNSLSSLYTGRDSSTTNYNIKCATPAQLGQALSCESVGSDKKEFAILTNNANTINLALYAPGVTSDKIRRIELVPVAVNEFDV